MTVTSISYNYATHQYEIYGVEDKQIVMFDVVSDPTQHKLDFEEEPRRLLKPPLCGNECNCAQCTAQ